MLDLIVAWLLMRDVNPIRTIVAQSLALLLPEYRRLTIDYAAISRVDYGARQHNLMFLNVGAVLRLVSLLRRISV